MSRIRRGSGSGPGWQTGSGTDFKNYLQEKWDCSSGSLIFRLKKGIPLQIRAWVEGYVDVTFFL